MFFIKQKTRDKQNENLQKCKSKFLLTFYVQKYIFARKIYARVTFCSTKFLQTKNLVEQTYKN